MTEREVQVRVAERNDHGSTAERNRDALGHASLFAGNLLVLATGTGGTGTGRVEANLAVSTVLTQFRQAQDPSIPQRLAASLSHANDVLRTRGAADAQLVGSGASVGAALVRDNLFFAARAGRVRVLIVRGERAIDAVTYDDDDFARSELDDTPAAREGALGSGRYARIVVSREPIRLVQGDRVLLVAPGLYDHVDTVQIARTVTSCSAQEAVARLVEAAQKAGASEGVSVQLLQYGEPIPTEVATRAAGERARAHSAMASPPPQPPARPDEVSRGPEPPMVAPLRPAPARDARPRAAAPAERPKAAARDAAPPVSAQPLEPTAPEWRDSMLAASAEANRRKRRPRGPSLLEERKLVLTVGGALMALMLLLVWSPWSTGEDSTTDEPSAAPTSAVEGAGSVRSLLGRAEAKEPRVEAGAGLVEEGPTDGEDGAEAETESAPFVRNVVAASAPSTFWEHFDRAIQSGDRIDEARVTAWLRTEGGDVTETARKRHEELLALDAVLAPLSVPDDTLSAKDRKALDAIFAKEPRAAADGLKEYIERQHGKVGDAIFETVSAYLLTHRTPGAAQVLGQLARRRLGPKTRAWVQSKAVTELMAQ